MEETHVSECQNLEKEKIERKRAKKNKANSIEELKRELGELKLGEHLCGIYRNKEEQLSIVIPLILAGLEKNEKLVYILDESTKEEIVQAFKKLNINIEEYINSKQLEFLTKENAYLKGGYFDLDRMVELLKQSEDVAIKDGYKGLRVIGEMTWALTKLPGVEKLIEYEAKVNLFLPRSRSAGICLYNESKFTSEILLDAIYTHPKIVLQGSISENPNYIPPDDFFVMTKGKMAREIYERVRDEVVDRAKGLKEHERAEEALKKSEEHYRTLVETMNDGLNVLDENGIITYVNDKFCEILGFPREEMLGRHISETIDENSRSVMEEHLAEERKGKRVSYELVRTRKDGQKIFTFTSASPVFDADGRLKGTFAVITDIAERKRTKERLVFGGTGLK